MGQARQRAGGVCLAACVGDGFGRPPVVADRGNNRIEIFDQDGKFIAEWKQFGRPSGLFIDKNDILYCTDSESLQPSIAASGAGSRSAAPGTER